jgi:hypothetical protein
MKYKCTESIVSWTYSCTCRLSIFLAKETCPKESTIVAKW